MPNYRRSSIAGGTFFFTVVAEGRRPILVSEDVRAALREAIRAVRADRPFGIDAWVLLPDHMHCVWTLPTGDGDFSSRWSAIKRLTTQRALGSESRNSRREGSLWQRRFWEHTVRDEGDLVRHIEYIHWNPVRHRLVQRPAEWPFSSFHAYVSRGAYPASWGREVGDLVGAE